MLEKVNRVALIYRRRSGQLICAHGALLLMLLIALSCRRADTERLYQSPYLQPRSVAVVPFRNQSGSESLDVIAVTDAFYTELQQIDGLFVFTTNRTLAALSELNLNNVNSSIF